MKTLISLILFSLLICAASAYSESEKWDAIHLKNGFVVEGDIVELVVNEYVKIKLINGIVNTYQMRDILKIEKVPRPRKEEPPPKKDIPTPQQVQQLKKSVPPPPEQNQPTNLNSYNLKPSDMPGYRSPGTAFLLSFLFTGAGQFYNGDVGKGLAQIAISVTGVALVVSSSDNERGYYGGSGNGSSEAGGIVLVLGAWLWSMIDAPSTASRNNRKLLSGNSYGHLLEVESGEQIFGLDLGIKGKSLGGKVTLHF